MASQGVAKWDGLDVQVHARMTRTPGVVPDTGLLVFHQFGTLPSSINGTLAFYYAASLISQWNSCRIAKVLDVRGKVFDWQYTVKDRRWKWKYPILQGRYNLRDDDNKIILETKKTPRELATIILTDMGETGFSVAALPTDAELSPTCEWEFAPAAAQLQNLVAMFGCDVHLLPDDTVSIQRNGVGTDPPLTDLAKVPATGLSITDAPDDVSAFAGDTLFESWFELEPIMYDYPSGKVELLDASNLKPAAGWVTVDIDQCLQVAVAEADPIVKQRKQQMAKDGLYRLWRIKKFAGAATKPPGYTGAAVTDMRLLLPLLPTRLIPDENTTGAEKKMAPAEVGGFFFDKRYSTADNCGKIRMIDSGFQIDIERGHVKLAQPAYKIDTSGAHTAGVLWLRCGYRLRESLYGSIYTHGYTVSTGFTNGTQPEWVNRSDVQRTVIAMYPADYAEPFTVGTPLDNETAIETILQEACNQRIYEYAVTQDPTVYYYTKLKSVATSGRCRQVTHECGQGKIATTTASAGCEHDRRQPLAVQKQQMQRDADAATRGAQNFVQVVKFTKFVVGLFKK